MKMQCNSTRVDKVGFKMRTMQEGEGMGSIYSSFFEVPFYRTVYTTKIKVKGVK